MTIIKEKVPLMEMSFLPFLKVPKDLSSRVSRLVIDQWYYDRTENYNELDVQT